MSFLKSFTIGKSGETPVEFVTKESADILMPKADPNDPDVTIADKIAELEQSIGSGGVTVIPVDDVKTWFGMDLYMGSGEETSVLFTFMYGSYNNYGNYPGFMTESGTLITKNYNSYEAVSGYGFTGTLSNPVKLMVKAPSGTRWKYVKDMTLGFFRRDYTTGEVFRPATTTVWVGESGGLPTEDITCTWGVDTEVDTVFFID